MTQADARRDLDKLAVEPLVRGIRHQMHHHHNPLYRFAPDAETVGSARVIANVGQLADYGFVFELQVFAGQIEPALRLVEACPDVTFVLQHAMMPEDRSEAGREAWRAAMERIAACPNVVCKLSGLGTFLHANDPEHIAGVVDVSLALFGADRCLYGSNFPIEKLWTDYGSLIGAMRAALEKRKKAERQAVFHDVAARIYRLEED